MYEAISSVPLQIDVEESINETINIFLTFLPRLLAALLILLVGWIIGRVLGGIVERLIDSIGLDRKVLQTPLGDALGGTEGAVMHAFGLLTRWFVYALAILAAADVLAIAVLSQWINTALAYLPAFIAGLLIIVLGFVVADFVGDVIARTATSIHRTYRRRIATGIQIFLYFVVIVIGLDTMGVDVDILFVFARALAWGLAAAIAIAVGIAFGLGGKEYVEENIDRWTHESKSEVRSDTRGEGGTEPDRTDD